MKILKNKIKKYFIKSSYCNSQFSRTTNLHFAPQTYITVMSNKYSCLHQQQSLTTTITLPASTTPTTPSPRDQQNSVTQIPTARNANGAAPCSTKLIHLQSPNWFFAWSLSRVFIFNLFRLRFTILVRVWFVRCWMFWKLI